MNKNFVKPSFESISGYGANSAIIHHRPSETLIEDKSTYLLDSGSHYLYGTTDITRTLHFGDFIDPEIKKFYTLVLKGQLQGKMLKSTIKSYKTVSSFVPRLSLYQHNQDYRHGTGHGVGFFGNVHEHSEFEDFSVFSVEPGYYKENGFGIRLEDVVFTRKCSEEFLCTKELTFVPYQKSLVEESMLTSEERQYLKFYSELVEKLVGSHLNEEEREYLKNNSFV